MIFIISIKQSQSVSTSRSDPVARGTLDAARIAKRNTSLRKNHRSHPLRVGFVPLADCAPLVMAEALGRFAMFGLNVELHREVGWATIRDAITLFDASASRTGSARTFSKKPNNSPTT